MGRRQPAQLQVYSGIWRGLQWRVVARFLALNQVQENAQHLELATWLAGQIARAAAIFNADEVVVIDESNAPEGHVGKGAALLARVLQHMETPQYLRRALLPVHPDLKHIGMVPPLDAPHHMRATEWVPYREGVVTQSSAAQGSFINVGLDKPAHSAAAARESSRVTCFMGDEATVQHVEGAGDVYAAEICLPSEPREQRGLYWGYVTRIARGLSEALQHCPLNASTGKYDLILGTSERGSPFGSPGAPGAILKLPPFTYALVVFGGPLGLEACAAKDPNLQGCDDVRGLFDLYLNTCPAQGSRTIRTEEAILISMALLQGALSTAGQ